MPILLENVPLNLRQQMWYQHDGCSAASARAITTVLNREFGTEPFGFSFVGQIEGASVE